MKEQTKKITRREALRLAVSYKQDLENKVTENHALRLNLSFAEEFLTRELGDAKLEEFKTYLNQRMMETIAAGSVGAAINRDLAETAVNGAELSGADQMGGPSNEDIALSKH